MNNWMRYRSSQLGPRPGDFPLGSLESRAAARAVQVALDLETQRQLAEMRGNVTPIEQAFCELLGDPEAKGSALHMVRKAIIPKYKLLGLQLPTPEELRLMRQVPEEMAKIERERAARGDTSFLNKEALRQMAEDRLLTEHRACLQTGPMTAEAAATAAAEKEGEEEGEGEDE